MKYDIIYLLLFKENKMALKREDVYRFAEKYRDMFLDMTSTRESIEAAGFGDDCYNMNFGNDAGRKFIVMTPNVDAFNKVEDLEKVIDDLDGVAMLGSACFGKWISKDDMTAEDRLWFTIVLGRIMELTDEPEAMTVQELSKLLEENREKILKLTEVNPWEIDLWIHEPTQLMNMDSGIAYDVTEVLGISINDIIDAVEREEMLNAFF